MAMEDKIINANLRKKKDNMMNKKGRGNVSFNKNSENQVLDKKEKSKTDKDKSENKNEANKNSLKKNNFKSFLDKVKNLLFPQDETCDICLGELPYKNRYNLCSKCAEELEIIKGKVCVKCGCPIDNEADYCLRCMGAERIFDKNRSALLYDGLAKKVILSFKYGEKKYLKRLLSRLMVDKYIENGYKANLITYVPMSPKEFKQRGYNQSKLLAEEIGASLKIEVKPLLKKIGDTSTQKRLSAKEREENLKGAFQREDINIKGEDILLIDDVFTTGVTSNECSKVLYKMGAKSVSVLTAAITKMKPYLA